MHLSIPRTTEIYSEPVASLTPLFFSMLTALSLMGNYVEQSENDTPNIRSERESETQRERARERERERDREREREREILYNASKFQGYV